MEEFLDLIVAFFKALPPTAVDALLVGLLAWFIKYQLGINKVTDDRFKHGTTNFEMIDKHFEKVDDSFMEVGANFEMIHLQVKGVHKMVLKNIIYNDSLDLFERLEAYDEYIGLGGNGFTHAYYENHLKPLLEDRLKEKD